MSRQAKPSGAPPLRHSKRAEIEVANVDGAALLRVTGLLDEHFPVFGEHVSASTIIVDVSGIRFITSFGVRQWLRAMAALPPTVRHVYLAGCPRMFVDQLNMILNFGGHAQILTLFAPYMCTACGAESDELIDAIAHTSEILAGRVPERICKKCNGRLVLDETPEVYFACLTKYGPRNVEPSAMHLLNADTRAVAKQVLKPELPKTAAAAGSKSTIVWWVVLAITVLAIVAGLYVLINPS